MEVADVQTEPVEKSEMLQKAFFLSKYGLIISLFIYKLKIKIIFFQTTEENWPAKFSSLLQYGKHFQ
mgnify:CR=1 FL=1